MPVKVCRRVTTAEFVDTLADVDVGATNVGGGGICPRTDVATPMRAEMRRGLLEFGVIIGGLKGNFLKYLMKI